MVLDQVLFFFFLIFQEILDLNRIPENRHRYDEDNGTDKGRLRIIPNVPAWRREWDRKLVEMVQLLEDELKGNEEEEEKKEDRITHIFGNNKCKAICYKADSEQKCVRHDQHRVRSIEAPLGNIICSQDGNGELEWESKEFRNLYEEK